jgi:hypothetical protein
MAKHLKYYFTFFIWDIFYMIFNNYWDSNCEVEQYFSWFYMKEYRIKMHECTDNDNILSNSYLKSNSNSLYYKMNYVILFAINIKSIITYYNYITYYNCLCCL